MDNHVVLRTVLIILAAAVLFSLIYYYNTKQNVIQAQISPARDMQTERFYQGTSGNQGVRFGPASSSIQASQVGFEPPRIVNETQRQLNSQSDDTEDSSVNNVKPSESDISSEYKSVDFTGQKLPSDCFPKDRLTTEDLLPKDAANLKWSAVNPAGQGDVSNINFVQAGAMMGINSTLGSMRNANLQLRSDPVIPNQQSEWPIMMSTIPRNSSLLRRPLEISGDCGEF